MSPSITVLMSVFNGEMYLQQAIESVLGQTFSDYEFVIVDDGSWDGSARIARSYRDGRIRVLRNDANLGLSASLNRGLDEARGRFVARMDADDVSLPTRLERQVAFLEGHPDIGVCGAWIRKMSPEGNIIRKFPTSSRKVRCALLFNSCIPHPSAVMRAQVAASYRYSTAFKRAQDYDLWTRCAEEWALANVPEVLLEYRSDGDVVTQEKAWESRKEYILRIHARLLEGLGMEPTRSDLARHLQIARCEPMTTRDSLRSVRKWANRIYAANERVQVYDKSALAEALMRKMWDICLLSSHKVGWAALPEGLACRMGRRTPLFMISFFVRFIVRMVRKQTQARP